VVFKYQLSWILNQLSRFSLWSTLLLSRWVSRFLSRKVKTASFGAPPIYTHSYLFPPHKSTHQTPFLTWETPLTLYHTPLASSISNLWREIFDEIEELQFLCFISKSFLFFLIRALVLHWVLCGFITLGTSSFYTTRCLLRVSKSCGRPQESLYYPLVWANISVWAWPLWSAKGGLGLKETQLFVGASTRK
jgi:hypothetical protein